MAGNEEQQDGILHGCALLSPVHSLYGFTRIPVDTFELYELQHAPNARLGWNRQLYSSVP
jgi:hypothetical protein